MIIIHHHYVWLAAAALSMYNGTEAMHMALVAEFIYKWEIILGSREVT